MTDFSKYGKSVEDSQKGSSNLSKYGAEPNVLDGFANAQSNNNSFLGRTAEAVRNVANTERKIIGGVGNAIISSEKSFAGDISAGLSGVLPTSMTGVEQAQSAKESLANSILTIVKTINTLKKTGKDTSKYEAMLKDYTDTANKLPGWADLYPEINKSASQVLGDAGGVLLDTLSAGTYGTATKGMQAGKLFTTAEKTAQAADAATKANIIAKSAETVDQFGNVIPATEETVKKTLGGTLKNIAANTAVASAKGGSLGYAYDVAGNLQSGKTGNEALSPGLGTLTGSTVPVIIGGIKAGLEIGKDTAPRFINSLIKPKAANFAYGKNPGRTVSEMGITGNSISDFADNITTARKDIGSEIGNIYSNPENAKLKIDVRPEISKIDEAISKAAKGGKGNQNIVTALQNVKDSILYEHAVNADGLIEKVGTIPRDLSSLTPKEAFDLKKIISEQTKFNGTPSDDKAVNTVLQSVYGGIKDKLNKTVGTNNPEILKLNQRYADLISAELATKNREAIIARSNMVGLKTGGVGTAATIGALITGSAALPATLVGLSAAALEKAMGTTAAKTRIAAWLGKEKPSVIMSVFEKNPEIKTVIYRLLPNLASKIK